MIPFYLLFLIVAFSTGYVVLFFLFPAFFGAARPSLGRRSLFSILMIVVFIHVVLVVVANAPDAELGNRILHALGGGVLAFFLCYRVVRDTRLEISRFRFFLFSFLVVQTLGVGNEIFEFVLAQQFALNFAPTPNDTWLDLVSNTVGAFIGGALFTALVGAPYRSTERA